MTTKQAYPNTHPQPLELSDSDRLTLRQAQYRELDRLLDGWQRASGREFDDPPHLEVDAVIRRARLALYDNSATPYEIVLFTLAELFHAPGDGTLERIDVSNVQDQSAQAFGNAYLPAAVPAYPLRHPGEWRQYRLARSLAGRKHTSRPRN